MKFRLTTQRNKFAILFVILLFDPLRCSAPQTMAAQFPPAIVITEGKTAEGFPYMSGGVGADERLALKERAKAFNVKLVFAAADGSYIADVKLEIGGAKNQAIVSTATTGPWFFIELPPGTYSVKATFAGQSKEVTALRVSKDKRAYQVFVWNLAGDLTAARKANASRAVAMPQSWTTNS